MHRVQHLERLGPGEACVPVWNPALGELTSNHVGPKPRVVPVSAAPTGRLAAMAFCHHRVLAGGTRGQRALLSPGHAGAVVACGWAATATASVWGRGTGLAKPTLEAWATGRQRLLQPPMWGRGALPVAQRFLHLPAPSPPPSPPTRACCGPGQAGPRVLTKHNRPCSCQGPLAWLRSLSPQPLASQPGKGRAKAGSVSTYSAFKQSPHNPL